MTTQPNPGHVETVIIGAGQAGLATGYHLQRRGRDVRDPRRRRARRRPVAPAVGHPAALLPREVRRPARPAVPRRPAGPSPARTRWPTTSSSTPRTTTSRCGSASASRRSTPRPDGGFTVATRPTGGPAPATTSWWPPAPSAGRPSIPDFAARARPRDPAAALERVPPPGPAPRRAGAGRRRLALGHRHRLRGRADPPDHPGRPRLRPDPGRFDSWLVHGVFPVVIVFPGGTCSPGVRRWAARRCSRSASTVAR